MSMFQFGATHNGTAVSSLPEGMQGVMSGAQCLTQAAMMGATLPSATAAAAPAPLSVDTIQKLMTQAALMQATPVQQAVIPGASPALPAGMAPAVMNPALLQAAMMQQMSGMGAPMGGVNANALTAMSNAVNTMNAVNAMSQINSMNAAILQAQIMSLCGSMPAAASAAAPAPAAQAPSVASLDLQSQSSKQDESAASSETAEESYPPAVLKVSCSTKLCSLAGSIAKRIRSSQEVLVEAMGPVCVTRAMTALRLAGVFLKVDDIVLHATCSFMHVPKNAATHPGLRFVASGLRNSKEREASGEQMTVAADSEVGKVARTFIGAINAAPESFKVTFGPSEDTINVAAKALALASGKLKQSDIQLVMQPCLDTPMPTSVQRSLTYVIIPMAVKRA